MQVLGCKRAGGGDLRAGAGLQPGALGTRAACGPRPRPPPTLPVLCFLAAGAPLAAAWPFAAMGAGGVLASMPRPAILTAASNK